MKIKTLFLLITLLPKISVAQLAICYDDDQFTNIRQSPSFNSKIIGKIIEGQVFAISAYKQEENPTSDWFAISFPKTSNSSEKEYLKFDGEENTGYVHKSRLVKLENLKKLKITEINKNKVLHKEKDFQVSIETQIFKKSEHKIIRKKDGNYLIDGEKSYPYYGGNTTEIKSITLKNKNSTYTFPKKSFKNYFMIDAAYSTVYKGTKEECYLAIDAGDGADGYSIVYCIKNNTIFSMTITSTLP